MVKSRQPREDQGFTLIELLIVMIILGILASVAILAFTGANKFSALKACQADVVAVNAAMNSYANDFPYSSSGLTSTDLYGAGTLSASPDRFLSPLDAGNKPTYEVSLSISAVTTDTPGVLPYLWQISVKGASGSTVSWSSNTNDFASLKGLCSQVIS